MRQVADGLGVQVVAGVIDDILGGDPQGFGYAVQPVALVPFVIHPIDRQDIQHLVGIDHARVVRQAGQVAPQDGGGFQPELLGDVEDGVALLDGVLGDGKAGAVGQLGVQAGQPRNAGLERYGGLEGGQLCAGVRREGWDTGGGWPRWRWDAGQRPGFETGDI